jgi:hypothetical protein
MTAHYIARVVQSLYEKINIDEMLAEFEGVNKYEKSGYLTDEWRNKQIKNKAYIRWAMACGLLERYCQMNMGKFKETELVYRWAKDCCIKQNNLINRWKMIGGYSTFADWLNKNKFGRLVK